MNTSFPVLIAISITLRCLQAVHARSDLFERRRTLMEQWAAYLSAERGHVVPMVRRRG